MSLHRETPCPIDAVVELVKARDGALALCMIVDDREVGMTDGCHSGPELVKRLRGRVVGIFQRCLVVPSSGYGGCRPPTISCEWWRMKFLKSLIT
jgi:hypothetical protein